MEWESLPILSLALVDLQIIFTLMPSILLLLFLILLSFLLSLVVVVLILSSLSKSTLSLLSTLVSLLLSLSLVLLSFLLPLLLLLKSFAENLVFVCHHHFIFPSFLYLPQTAKFKCPIYRIYRISYVTAVFLSVAILNKCYHASTVIFCLQRL